MRFAPMQPPLLQVGPDIAMPGPVAWAGVPEWFTRRASLPGIRAGNDCKVTHVARKSLRAARPRDPAPRVGGGGGAGRRPTHRPQGAHSGDPAPAQVHHVDGGGSGAARPRLWDSCDAALY